MGDRSVRSLIALLLLGLVASGMPPIGASAQEPDPLIADSLGALSALVTKETCQPKDAYDGDTSNGFTLAYVHCNDGLPPAGGGASGIPVPAKYHSVEGGNDYVGLPPPASEEEVVAASATDDLQPDSGNRITLDVNVTLPPSASATGLFEGDPALTVKKVPRKGFPVIVLMHGCCGGNKTSWEATSVDAANEHWHHSNAWFASRGYVVITYTARGFRNSEDRGSTGTTQLDSRRYEINDYQYLVGLLADHDKQRRAAGEQPLFNVNPKKVGAVGGSYGGGWSWLALTDPTWKSPLTQTPVRLAAAVPKYGWTDLVEALVPSGHYLDRNPKTGKTSIASTDPSKALSRSPIGVEKQSIVSGLYATGNAPNGNHTTFPSYMHDAFARLQQGEPYDGDPNMETLADWFLNDRSAYYQQHFWNRVAKGLKVPVFIAATWTDPLFPTMESVRFYNKLEKLNPKYPAKMYLGDYQHFVANKPKEWDDLCGSDHHVCTVADYSSPALKKPLSRVREGINSRINRFLDHFLMAKGKRPAMDVSATTTICAANATEKYPVDEPGVEYRAADWRSLAPRSKVFGWEGGGPLFSTTSSTAADGHAAESDPVARDRQANKCFTTSQTDAGPGVVRFVHEPLEKPFTMLGIPQLKLKYAVTGENYWIAVRLMDRSAEGAETLVTRGICRVDAAAHPDRTCEVFDLWGNGWVFDKGHQVVLEVTQADTPMFRRNNMPSTIQIESASLDIPVTSKRRKVDFRDRPAPPDVETG